MPPQVGAHRAVPCLGAERPQDAHLRGPRHTPVRQDTAEPRQAEAGPAVSCHVHCAWPAPVIREGRPTIDPHRPVMPQLTMAQKEILRLERENPEGLNFFKQASARGQEIGPLPSHRRGHPLAAGRQTAAGRETSPAAAAGTLLQGDIAAQYIQVAPVYQQFAAAAREALGPHWNVILHELSSRAKASQLASHDSALGPASGQQQQAGAGEGRRGGLGAWRPAP